MQIAFVANLDAELELTASSDYQPSTRMLAAMAERSRSVAAQLARSLSLSVVTLVPGATRPGGAKACAASLCWCPTPRALATLRLADAPPCAAPPLHVLRRVNHRAFAAELGPMLPGARHVRSPHDVAAALATSPGPWLLKRAFGFSGRGRKQVPGGRPLDDATRTWVERSFTEHGGSLQVEPLVQVIADFALHGHVDEQGAVRLGQPTRQDIAADGSWRGSRRTDRDDLDDLEHDVLEVTARRAAIALHRAGYSGPFGIDAYRWRDAGRTLFHPLSEINARLSMGWFVGMGERAGVLLTGEEP